MPRPARQIPCLPGLVAGALLIWLGVTAQAAPPADFAGDLFIDRSGCVLMRMDGRWQARLLADGGPDCGYPPTPVAADGPVHRRGTDLPLHPDIDPIEARLLATMAAGLMPGDLASAALPVAPDGPDRAGAEGPGHPLARELAAAVTPAGIAARMIAAGDRPNARLCELLGQGDAARMFPGPGADPSRGFCPGPAPAWLTMARMAAPSAMRPDRAGQADGRPLAGAVVEADAGAVAGAGVEAGAAAGIGSAPARARPGRSPVARTAIGTATGTATGPAAAADPVQRRDPGGSPPPPAGAEMIPAGARYLQVAVSGDLALAEPHFARIAGLGLPAARGRSTDTPGILVLAGPFDSRQAIVRAYSRLRSAGFVRILPR